MVPARAVPFENAQFDDSFIPLLLFGMALLFLGIPVLLGSLTFRYLKRRQPAFTSSRASTMLLPCVSWGGTLVGLGQYPKPLTYSVAVLAAISTAVGAYFISRRPEKPSH